MSTVRFPIMYINDPDKGRPLFNGQLYIGKPDLDPQILANRKTVYYIEESGALVEASQPIMLNAGGNPTYNGKPVTLDVDGAYSFKALSKLGVQSFYIANTDNTEGSSSLVSKQTLQLTSGQTTVIFTSVMVESASIYIGSDDVDRGRLIEGVDYSVTGSLTIELTQSFPVGTYCTAIASEDVVTGADQYIRRYTDTSSASIDTTLKANDVVNIKSRGNSIWDVVLTASVTNNTYNIINAAGLFSLSLRIDPVNNSSEQFGMLWDGTSDDAAAYESASNTMATLKLQLNHPAKTCIIGRDVTVTGSINQKGQGGWTLFNSGTVINTGAYKIKFVGNEPQLTSMLFQGASELTGTNIHFETADPENDQNVDAKLISCLFYRAYYSVSMIGRGITFESCGFSLFRRSLKVDWPDPFVAPSLLEQSLKYGMRGYNFFDCQWHASNGYIIENTGYNKDNFRGVVITGYPDTELSIIDGSINDFLIDLNMLYGSQSIFLLGATHKAYNGKVTGTYAGVRDSANLDTGFANVLSMTATSEIDSVEFDMNCRDVRGTSFALSGVVGDLMIRGSYNSICKQNDSSITASTRYFIEDFSATYTGKVIFEGNLSLENFAANPTYLVNGLTDEEFEQGHVTLPSYTELFGGNCRGRFGSISRHVYTGNGTVDRVFTLPAVAQYVSVASAQPDAAQGKAGIAIEASFGGTGDVVMPTNKSLKVTDDFNISAETYIYIVHY